MGRVLLAIAFFIFSTLALEVERLPGFSWALLPGGDVIYKNGIIG
jgi:hypothetical protein